MRRAGIRRGSCTGGVEQNVQVPKGGGRGIRIGPQGLPLLHRRALRLRLGLMDAPPRHLQGTPALPFPFAPDRSDPPWGRAEAFTVSLIRFVGWKRSVYRWFCCSTSGSETPGRYAMVYLVCGCSRAGAMWLHILLVLWCALCSSSSSRDSVLFWGGYDCVLLLLHLVAPKDQNLWIRCRVDSRLV